VPHIRSFTVEAGQQGKIVYRPIESFGEVYMLADSWHTNAAGYELITKAVLEVLKSDPSVKAYLAAQIVAAEPSAGQAEGTLHGIDNSDGRTILSAAR